MSFFRDSYHAIREIIQQLEAMPDKVKSAVFDLSTNSFTISGLHCGIIQRLWLRKLISATMVAKLFTVAAYDFLFVNAYNEQPEQEVAEAFNLSVAMVLGIKNFGWYTRRVEDLDLLQFECNCEDCRGRREGHQGGDEAAAAVN